MYDDLFAVLAGLFLFIGLISLVALVLYVVCYWKIFTKAGEEGWKVLIPFYNMYIMFKIAWETKWFFITLALAFVGGFLSGLGFAAFSLLFTLAASVIGIIFSVQLARAFGKSDGFAVGLIFLSFIFYPILAFGSAQYERGKVQQVENPTP